MNVENLKITTYADNVKDLPDYPSDEGYTAEMLKAMFDARSDNEIKEKHNTLVDAVGEKFSELKTADGNLERSAKEYADGIISEHDKDEDSHRDIRNLVSGVEEKHNALVAELSTHSENKENPHEVTKTQLGLSNVDNTSDMDKPISRAVGAALSEHSENKENPHEVSAEQIGAYTKKEAEDALGDISAALDTIIALQRTFTGGDTV